MIEVKKDDIVDITILKIKGIPLKFLNNIKIINVIINVIKNFFILK